MILVLTVILLLTKLLNQLVNLGIRQPLITIIFKPIMRLDDQLEQLLGGFQQLELAIVQLLEVLFL